MTGDDEKKTDKLLESYREQASIAVTEMAHQRPNPSGEAKREAASRLDDFRRQLLKHRNEKALIKPWDGRGVDVIPKWLSATTTVERELNRRGNPTDSDTVPIVYKVGFQKILRAHRELEDIYDELGFSAAIDSPKDRYRVASPDDQDHPEPVSENVAKPGE